MACNVFGHPIDEEFLRNMAKYHDQIQITRDDLASVALDKKNAGGNDVKARNYVWSLKKDWDKYVENAMSNHSVNNKTCFCVLIYNATGGTITYVDANNKKGSLGHSPHPSSIENGQWGTFLHVQNISDTSGSTGGVVYRGKKINEEQLDWIMTWNNPGPDDFTRINIYGQVLVPGINYKDDKYWKAVYKIMEDKNEIRHYNKVAGRGGVFDGTSGRGVAPIFEAVLTLENQG